MATTRDFKSIGQWALNADTVIPAEPIEGVAYRDTAFNQAENEVGQEFKEKINSAEWNEALYTTTSLTNVIDSRGIPGWSDLVDYLGIDSGNFAIAWGSDGKLYQALQANGPSSTVQDPTVAPLFWEVQHSAADYANETPGQEGSLLVGYTNQTVKAALDDRGTAADYSNETPGNEGTRLIGYTNETAQAALDGRYTKNEISDTTFGSSGASLVGNRFGTSIVESIAQAKCLTTTASGSIVLEAGSINVTSVTFLGTGNYQINFTNPIGSYIPLVLPGPSGVNHVTTFANRTTTSIEIQMVEGTNSSSQNNVFGFLAI